MNWPEIIARLAECRCWSRPNEFHLVLRRRSGLERLFGRGKIAVLLCNGWRVWT